MHSLKDLPTSLPHGLKLGAVSKRADVRDVLIYRDAAFFANEPSHNWAGGSEAAQSLKRGFGRGMTLWQLPEGSTVATSSTRRSAQVREQRPDLKTAPIRGNVGTRLNKLAALAEFDAIMLAAAGLERLGIKLEADGSLHGENLPKGLLATTIEVSEMLPCVGQAALGIEIRDDDPITRQICERLNDYPTMQCVCAERAVLRAMGGGCQIAVAAYAQAERDELYLRVVSFLGNEPRRAEGRGPIKAPESLGEKLAHAVSERQT